MSSIRQFRTSAVRKSGIALPLHFLRARGRLRLPERTSGGLMRSFVFSFCLLLAIGAVAADNAAPPPPRFVYQKAPQVIHEVLNSRPTPTVVISPAHDRLLAV